MACNIGTKPENLGQDAKGTSEISLSLSTPLHLKNVTVISHRPSSFFFLVRSKILPFIRSSVSQKCKHCRIQRCPCLGAVWRNIPVTYSIFLYFHSFLSGIEHSPQRNGGSLKLRAPKRKSFVPLQQMCPATKI